MLPASTIILEYVCPALGTIAANLMFFAPFRDVQKAIARGSLGDLNPLPWVFMLGNTFGWVTYGILKHNLFIFFANAPGFLLATWFNLAASKLQFQQQFAKIPSEDAASTTIDDSSHHPPPKKAAAATESSYSAPAHDYWVMGMTAFWMGIAALIGFGSQRWSNETQQLIVGAVVNVNLVFFYGAPLSTIWTVLQTRTTASIHVGTMLTNTANGCFWTAYGFAVMDYFIFVPNGLGAVLGFVQMMLCLVFPRANSATAEAEVDAPENDNTPIKPKDDEEAGKGCASSKTALMVDNSAGLSAPFASLTPIGDDMVSARDD